MENLKENLRNENKYVFVVDDIILNKSINYFGYTCDIVPDFIEQRRSDRPTKVHRWLNSKKQENKIVIYITKNYNYLRLSGLCDKYYVTFYIRGKYSDTKLMNKLIEFTRTYKVVDGAMYVL